MTPRTRRALGLPLPSTKLERRREESRLLRYRHWLGELDRVLEETEELIRDRVREETDVLVRRCSVRGQAVFVYSLESELFRPPPALADVAILLNRAPLRETTTLPVLYQPWELF